MLSSTPSHKLLCADMVMELPSSSLQCRPAKVETRAPAFMPGLQADVNQLRAKQDQLATPQTRLLLLLSPQDGPPAPLPSACGLSPEWSWCCSHPKLFGWVCLPIKGSYLLKRANQDCPAVHPALQGQVTAPAATTCRTFHTQPCSISYACVMAETAHTKRLLTLSDAGGAHVAAVHPCAALHSGPARP